MVAYFLNELIAGKHVMTRKIAFVYKKVVHFF
jgi:hypothetical protein